MQSGQNSTRSACPVKLTDLTSLSMVRSVLSDPSVPHTLYPPRSLWSSSFPPLSVPCVIVISSISSFSRSQHPFAETKQSDTSRAAAMAATSATTEGPTAPGGSAPDPKIELRDLLPGDLGYVLSLHGSLYWQEYGWDQAFERLVARVLGEFDPGPRERGWIATVDGERAGCVFLVRAKGPEAPSPSAEDAKRPEAPDASGVDQEGEKGQAGVDQEAREKKGGEVEAIEEEVVGGAGAIIDGNGSNDEIRPEAAGSSAATTTAQSPQPGAEPTPTPTSTAAPTPTPTSTSTPSAPPVTATTAPAPTPTSTTAPPPAPGSAPKATPTTAPPPAPGTPTPTPTTSASAPTSAPNGASPQKQGDMAKLRLLLVDPRFRGFGLASLLVDTCLSFAREKGYRGVELWTHKNLTAARGMYARRGFRLIKEEPYVGLGGHMLVAESWEMEFV